MRKRFLLFWLVCLFFPALSASAKIPDDVTVYNGNSYKVYELTKTWKQAEEYCESLGGHLVTITSAGEQAFVQSLKGHGREYWLGGTDEKKEGRWRWVTGEAWNYSRWGAGEPDNNCAELPDEAGSKEENFLAMMSTGYWNDERNEAGLKKGYTLADHGFICEWEIGAEGTELSTGAAIYEVTKEGKEVSYKRTVGTRTKVTIPASITISGKTYKVTGISGSAFSKNSTITAITIGKNVKTIGKYAFFRAKKLKTLTIKTTKLTNNRVSKKAFTQAGVSNYKKLIVTVPAAKVKSYTALLRAKGLSRKATIKASGTSQTASTSTTTISRLTISQIKEKIIAHYTALWKPNGTYKIFGSETVTKSGSYRFILRVALTNGRSANNIVTMITVNRASGLVSDANGYAAKWYLK